MTGGTRSLGQRRGWVASIIAATAGPAPAIFFETFFVKISVKSSVQQNTPAAAASAQAHDGFSYSRDHFEELVDIALKHAKKLGATNAGAEASEGCGLSVSVRKGELENVERNRDKSLGVTVYVDHRRGNASTSDFSKAAIERTVQAAYDIARFTAEDPTAGLPDEADIETQHRDLDLFHPWAINSEEAAKIALQCEAAAMKTSRRITNSDGAAVSAQQSHFFSAHTHGFRGGYASSRHSISVAPIAKLPGRNAEMQRDAWYTSMRCADEMASPEAVGRYAAERALSRLGARKIATTECPVLFESPVAAGLLGGFVQAVSGGALYRKSSFLLDSLGKKVFPKHIDIEEDPHLLRGKGSSPFDDEGVRSVRRHVVKGGRVEGYFLSSYSARKLGMKTTGNAGGSHNLTLTSRLTQSTDDLDAMLQKLGTGLFVIELMGQGVNYVTGDYSRGASGFWVENGQIAYPVHEITIAGNLKDMFMGIEAVGADTYNMGAKTTGSILVNRMKLAGS
ncbi:metalloprotease PmbA [Limnohabitans sp. Hippo3]|uniref:metalloprotease PmbA n=1 Tax=Limnohabitans sp. Hippo3 TaxID=1597956 RepID=UPI000D342AC9|nr:metalloprotease PmbA [Limnohabitans sp. Hippo3]